MKISPTAGKEADTSILVDIPKLIAAYYNNSPDPKLIEQRVVFGTSGHRGSSLNRSFNESHLTAIAQAICLYRIEYKITGPLFLGVDTHALSQPALETVLEVLAANGVDVMLSKDDEYTPTPAVSHAIIVYNRNRKERLADGIVITPSHNPPDEGGIKYNPPHGGPAEQQITTWIEKKANAFLENKLQDIKKISLEQALKASTTHRYDYLNNYVNDLSNVIDMDIIRKSNVRMGVDPLGGAGVHYWKAIADRYGIDLTVVSDLVDPTFRMMTVDWDGKIRMDPSSPYVMKKLIGLKDRFDVAFACDTDHDRHGIVTKTGGLLPSNHYLSVAISYLFENRPQWSLQSMVGKTIVSSKMIDLVTNGLNRKLYEVPAGFKWFAEGLANGSLGFGGEESAGASFVRFDGSAWTTDKDGIILGLLAGEMTAKTGKDPSQLYQDLTLKFGSPFFERVDAPASLKDKEKLKKISADQIHDKELAGEKIEAILTHAPGNGASIGGVKVVTENGWFAARPSGTEDIYKIYAESFKGEKHLQSILLEAQAIVDRSLSSS